MTMKFYPVTKALDVSPKELWESLDNEYKGLSAPVTLAFTKKEDDDKKPSYRFVMSTDALDRHGERVYQNVDFTNFLKNPVVVDSHNYNSIERIIGKVIEPHINDEGQNVGDIRFFTDNPLGALAQAGVDQGYINAGSIGFIPKGFDDDGNITFYELLEFSMVSVPANPEALYQAKDIQNEEATKDDTEVVETKEEETPEEVPEQEDATDTEETTVKVVSQTPDTYTVLVRKLRQQNEVMKTVAQQLQDTKPQTLAQRKRKIFQELRKVI
jgi:hypothetical protein